MKRALRCALALALLLSGCGGKTESPPAVQPAPILPPPAQSEPEEQSPEKPPEEGLPPEGSAYEDWTLADFPGCLDGTYPTRREEYLLLAGTEWENTAVALHGAEEGPVIYIVAGLHGDEKAGWIAGDLLKEAALKAGSLYIVSPANPYGAERDRRTTKSDRDLNRNFPGDPEGWDAEQIAWAIYTDVAEKSPALLLDLHEARAKQEGRDALGNTLICQSLDGIGDLIFDLLLETENGTLCASPFSLYGSPPMGSVNRTVTLELGVPSVTVETYREEALSRRVRNQLEIVQYIFSHYNMI